MIELLARYSYVITYLIIFIHCGMIDIINNELSEVDFEI